MADEEPVRDASIVDEDRRPDPARDRDRDPSRDPGRDPRDVATDPAASGRAGGSMAGELAAAVVARAAAAALRPYAQVQFSGGEFAAARKAWQLAMREDGAAVFHSAAAITESERAEAAGVRWAPKASTPKTETAQHEQQRAAAVRLRPAQAVQGAQRRR